MGGLFGKPRHQRVTEQDKAVLKLKHLRDSLNQCTKRTQFQLEKERMIAKRLIHEGKKSNALLLLKKKKCLERMLERTDGQLLAVNNMITDIEFAQIEVQVVDRLRQGNEALKKIRQLMSLDDVEKIMEDSREAKEYQDEITSLLSGAMTNEDQAAAEEELNALISADIENLPDVPSHELPEVRNRESVAADTRPAREAMLAS